MTGTGVIRCCMERIRKLRLPRRKCRHEAFRGRSAKEEKGTLVKDRPKGQLL